MEILSFIIAIAVLIFILKILTLPFRIIIKFVINSIIGGLVVFVLGMFGIGIVMTWWTIGLIGLLGIPGVVIALIISMFI